MIDQPEFVIASDSKYKGVKPDEAKAVADAWRALIADTVTKNGRLFVVDQPGPDVLYVRMAASNVHLAKKKRGLLGYTPAGLVVGGAVAAGQDMQQKIILQDMNLEFEFMDSQSQEVLAAIVGGLIQRPPAALDVLLVGLLEPVDEAAELADRLGAVVSLSSRNTLGYRSTLGGRLFNTFLWTDPVNGAS